MTSPTTSELREWAIKQAQELKWMVFSEGDDYTACVIAHHPDKNTNWCRVMTIVDGVQETVSEQCLPTIWDSGFITKHLDTFKLNTQT
jgi:hypothetical protein|tara:strand:+ start:556 stop:819 length:264 start_codon:yes stop_codon:yes gene_type:complete